MLGHTHSFVLLESFNRIAVRAEQLIPVCLILEDPVVIGHATAATAADFLLTSTMNVVDVQCTRVRKTTICTFVPVFFVDSTAKLPLLYRALAGRAHQAHSST